METPGDAAPVATQPRPVRWRFQFRLRTMLIVMTGLAVLLSGLIAGPTWATLAAAMVVIVLLSMCATIALIYGQGMLRTFMIGSLFPLGAFLFISIMYWVDSLSSTLRWGDRLLSDLTLSNAYIKLAMVIFIQVDTALGLSFGLVAVAVRQLIERNAQPATTPPDSGPC